MRVAVLAFVVVGSVGCAREAADPAILTLGQQSVSRTEFEHYVNALEARGGGPLAPDVRREVLEAFLEERVLVLEARERGLVVPGAPAEDEQLAVRRLLGERYARVAAIGADQVERAYREQAEQCQLPEQVTLRQVLVPTENEAREVRRQVEKDAKQFDLLARTRSRSPEAAQGGVMGPFSRGQLPSELERAAFELRVGEVSPVVKSSLGYHVLRVEERQEARLRSLEECRDEIVARLERDRADGATRSYVRELMSRAQVNHEAAMAVRPTP